MEDSIALEQALEMLTPRQREVVLATVIYKENISKLAKEYHTNEYRIKLIKKKGLQKLQKILSYDPWRWAGQSAP
jgi:DNA-directed RNA polymerase specialized sigma24 family protein